MPDERGGCGGEGTPPETPDAIRLDAVTEDAPAAGALGLQGGFERVDGG